ncbi:uncharacterized protein LACBIDRAFT_297641 [Laccaria bicolor S238N-H82]|uniref:Predicted protein n=1 Tax=Laccaria bicolor (strain S238N-H82 / ATCC MYA-4686) TaxID=486041 RepID=B0DBN8_LACBS|nr:uncharacterized protein LACBIDRAFT_297641 [Laccaria bicolor S238N-H82]EDR08032.1 predicted protein [Laccaria bicolor S238N-H82]|eukprot:XP_001881102.1 predicted protein [Laccaria bicolor S238N-H82]
MPYCLGLHSAARTFLSAGFATHFTVAVIIFLFIVFITSSLEGDEVDAPVSLPGNPLLAIFPFFRKRYDFIKWGFHATGQNTFQFQLLRNKVIVVSGESARQAVFNAKGLDLTEGFKILSGAIPMVRGVTSDLQTKRIQLIHKRLANVQRSASLSALIPRLLEDSRKQMESWGPAGTFDPFDKVYELIFQLTMRSLSSSEISDDPATVARLKKLYDLLDVGTTPATVLIPWFPTPAMIKKLWATKEIYDIVSQAINARQQNGIRQDDTLQMLLDSGDEKLVIVGFIMGLLIAGARATGTTACWLITYLGGHPEWRAKAASEIEFLLASTPYSSDISQPLSSRLSTIPLDAWESSTPVLDAIIRETTRIAQPHTAMRRNIGPEIYINNKIIPTGAYVIYPFSDVHLDPEIYPDPWKFDPGRRAPEKTPFSYVGWGGGKTMCLGTRLAKLELKLVTAMFILGFQHSVVDKSGAPLNPLPTPNWNDILFARPQQGSFTKYERSSLPL